MNELVVIAEGPTEQAFVRDQLAGHLAIHGISTWAVLSGKSRKQGGVRKWEGAKADIVRTLKEGRYCSMMIDYYAMPEDWPGRIDAKRLQWNERAANVERAVSVEINAALGDRFNPKFFIPYVQLHEFEALTFSDVDTLAAVVSPVSGMTTDRLASYFLEVLEEAGYPEAINDGWETCPSRRISGVVGAYRKPLHGPIVTRRIGLEVLRVKCDHFASWLARLESIGAV